MREIFDKRKIVKGKYYLIYEIESTSFKGIKILRCSRNVGILNNTKYGTIESYISSESGRWTIEPYQVRNLSNLLGEVPITPERATVFELTDDEVLNHLVMEKI